MGLAIFFGPTDFNYIYAQSATYGDYVDAHDAASGTVSGATYVIPWNSYDTFNNNIYKVSRGFIHFDTSPLGGATPTAARLSFASQTKSEVDTDHSNLHIVEGVQSTPAIATDFGSHLGKTTSGGSIDYADIAAVPGGETYGYPNIITLNGTGRVWIDSSGTTKFCLRLSGDINNSTPTSYDNLVQTYWTTTYWVVTNAATSVTSSTATLNALHQGTGLEVTYSGSDPTYPRVRFQYGETDSYEIGNTDWQYGTPFYTAITADIGGLSGGTTYHFRAQAEISDGVFENGADETFATDAAGIPTVTTQEVTEITDVCATGNGNITDTGGALVTKRGFCWKISSGPTVNDDKAEDTSTSFGTGAFTNYITPILPGTLYYVKAYAYNAYGYGYGNEVTFTSYLDEVGFIWIEETKFHIIDEVGTEQNFENFDQDLNTTDSPEISELKLTPKASSTGATGTIYYDSDDDHVHGKVA